MGRVGNRYVWQGGQTENQGGQTKKFFRLFAPNFAHPGLKPCRRPWSEFEVTPLSPVYLVSPLMQLWRWCVTVPTRWSKKFDPSIRLDKINTETWQTDVDGQTDVVKQIKKLSWCWQTRATRLEVSQGHQTLYCTIPYVRYSFILVFYRNFVPKTHRFEILNFNNAVTLKTGLGVRQGHWKCYRLIEPIRLPIDVL